MAVFASLLLVLLALLFVAIGFHDHKKTKVNCTQVNGERTEFGKDLGSGKVLTRPKLMMLSGGVIFTLQALILIG